MILLDAYALIALLRDEPAADEVQRLLESETCSISAANLAETVDRTVRIQELPADAVEQTLLPLLEAVPITVTEINRAVAIEGGLLRARHYNRSASALSLADCLLLASALALGAAIATGEDALIGAAEEEGVIVQHLS
ncbi:MAG TPA: PIN domain-containing protein [Dehalococcoidia bacterium]|nr:PIN domain-containing protein [Dehalococcoidia bacterium]